jgi:hypothetical protein
MGACGPGRLNGRCVLSTASAKRKKFFSARSAFLCDLCVNRPAARASGGCWGGHGWGLWGARVAYSTQRSQRGAEIAEKNFLRFAR